ncbi:TMEM175 family protein [Methanoregula sp.]|jgi:uncharacterized membrane protein|uniref:TMEM175 family protein n=1 Tax=Methanoregula sp. TaxID=2052170 RepID=UPI003564A8DE
MTEPQNPSCNPLPKDRICTLNDAIYAFAMTLLVVTIDIPSKYEHAHDIAPVHSIMLAIIPDLIHFFIAFVMLAILWYFEHQRFQYLRHLDRPLLCMNMASLVFVCLIPFSTNIAGDYPFDTLGSIIFEINILAIGMIAFAQWMYIRNKATYLIPGFNLAHINREITWSLVFPLLSLGGIALAFIHIPGSVGIYILAPIIMAFLYWKNLA